MVDRSVEFDSDDTRLAKEIKRYIKNNHVKTPLAVLNDRYQHCIDCRFQSGRSCAHYGCTDQPNVINRYYRDFCDPLMRCLYREDAWKAAPPAPPAEAP